MQPLTDADLIRLLHTTEHSFVERKTTSYAVFEWVKAIIGFANSYDTNQQGVLFIGARDNGEIEDKSQNFDSIQKKLSTAMEDVYPPIYRHNHIFTENGRECLAVIVPGSPSKPHFAGHPYLRDGSQTVKAKESQYNQLIAWRLDKVWELQKWIEKDIIVRVFIRNSGMGFHQSQHLFDGIVTECNQFYVSVRYNGKLEAFPLSEIRLSFNHGGNRLQLEYTDPVSR